jgi:hypothetical protein
MNAENRNEPAAWNRLDRRIAVGLFLLTATTYACFFNGGGWNQNANFAVARAIVEQRRFSIDEFRTTGDVSRFQGRVYTNKSPGVGMAAAIPYAALYTAERLVGIDPNTFVATTINAWICTILVCGVPGALIPLMLYRWARKARALGRRRALVIALLVAFGTPLFAYSTALFAHVPSGSFLVLSFVAARLDRNPLLSGIAAGLAALTNYLCIPIVVLFALLQRGTRLAPYLLGAAGPLVLLAYYQHVTVGAFWRTPIETMEAQMTTPGAIYGILLVPRLEAFLGITISRYRGLFYIAPILILSIAGAMAWWRSVERRLDAFVLTITVAFFVLFNSSFNGWHGGDTIGPRYLVALIPLLGLWLCDAFTIPRGVWAPLAVISLAVNFLVTTVDPLPPVETRDPIGSYVVPLFLTGRPGADAELPAAGSWRHRSGHTSTNLDSINGVASAWSSFNIGELIFGPGSVGSVVPILMWMIVGIGALWRVAAPAAA